ncbi:hypothetical protein GCM10010193_57140 [Kitasatospora atroaurantiaca]|uniref:Carbohydrate binding protein n=1 Tax=Kitasatospora atroaurantiaca TaxID=285545 RepID=A0A561EN05_9ACTN|nr:hypothetical protein [Kitasatospora atroaurantiaca]TWE16962.1 hypothetical protein FB465_1957 [Kitasatospora atroaurantiaca]
MPDPIDQLAQRIADIERLSQDTSRSSRLAYSSIDDGALTVTADGKLRAIIGQQPDGTTAVTVVNGPPPPTPTTPAAISTLGGVSVMWDGTFADQGVCPLDFARVEVHAARTADVAPDATTLIGTIESPQGGRILVPTTVPVTVMLVARSTSGKASAPSGTATAGPAKVVAEEVIAGIIGELQLATNAVTDAKVAVGAINSKAIADAAITATKIGAAAVVAGKLASNAVTAGTIAADAITAREIAAGAITAAELAVGAVTTASLAAGAVTAGEIAAGSITGDRLTASTITASRIASNAVVAGKIAADAVTGREIKALSVTGDKIAANTITAGQIAAGAITADALAVGVVNNYIPDGSFEGPAGAALAAGGGASWSIAATGSGSAKSLKVDATAATTTTKSLALATVPARPGDQLFLRYDYQASSDWKGGAVKLYARWMDAGGATLGYSAAQSTTPVLGATWQTLAATVTAPAGTTTCRLFVESWQATAGSILFDNAEARPVLGQVQIADGTITAAKLSADAITGKTITGGTITGTTITGVNISGATLATAATGNRVETTSVTTGGSAVGMVRLYSGSAQELNPATISSIYDPTQNSSLLTLQSAKLTDPPKTGLIAPRSVVMWPQADIKLYSTPGKAVVDIDAGETNVNGQLSVRYTVDANSLYARGTSGPMRPDLPNGNVYAGSSEYDHIRIGNAEIIACNKNQWADLKLNQKLTVSQSSITADVPISVTGSGWQDINFLNGCSQLLGWQNVSYRRMPDGTVVLRGIVLVPSTFTSGVIGTIGDSSCRPKLGEVFPAATDRNVGANLFIQPNGNIELWNATGALGDWVSLAHTRWSCID